MLFLLADFFAVSPESIVIPIVSCIFGFPILAFIVICCLRHRAKMARERDRRRNYDMQDHAVSLVRFSPIHRLSEFKCCNVLFKCLLLMMFLLMLCCCFVFFSLLLFINFIDVFFQSLKIVIDVFGL